MQVAVYMATAPTGERYIGVTSQVPRKRWRFHVSTARRGVSACKRLAAAIVQHGMTEANFTVIGTFSSLETAKACERDLVEKTCPELNMTRGGDCRPPHTPESKAKLSAAHMGNTHAAGHKHSAETRARMSAVHTGKKFPGRKLSAETRAKISAGLRNSSAHAERMAAKCGVPNPEHAEKMRGRKASAETRAKMSASHKAWRARQAAEACK